MTHAAEMVSERWLAGTQVDLDVESRQLTMRALGRSVLGIDLDEHADAIADPMRIALSYIADRSLSPVRAPRWLPTLARRRARTAVKTLRKLGYAILEGCRADPTLDAPLVQALVAATDPVTGHALSDDDICNELLVFLLAGHDTTATALTYALWAIGRHQAIQEKMAAEVAAIGDRALTPDDLPQLGYTVQVLHEALRLCPPAAILGREALQDIEVDGYRVKAGALVVYSIYAVQRDPSLWENPLLFNPDRFSPEQAKRRDRWQYLPFGGGPRSCIGDHFAMLEATLALATIVRRTEIHSASPDFPMAVPFTTVAAAPIHAEVRARIRNSPV
jgi:cytochrome P450